MEKAIIEIGNVTHYFSKINVAVVKLYLPLSIGEHIQIKGSLTDFGQTVDSMQIDHQPIHRAEGGQSVSLKLLQIAREKDAVFKIL